MAITRFPEWLEDLPDYDNPGATNILNLVPKSKLSYGPWKQPAQLSTVGMDLRAQGAASGIDYSSNIFTFSGDAGKLYRYSGSTFTDVSKVGGYTSVSGYTDKVSRAWHFEAFNNAMLTTNFADPVQKWVMGTDSAFDDMAKNTSPRAKYMAVVQNHLVLANTDDAFDGHVGLRFWLSPVGNPLDDDWGNTDKQSDFRTLPSGREITGIVGGEFGIIFCRRAVYRMTYAGPPTIFQVDNINPQHGCVVPGSIAHNENRIFYLAEDGFQTMINGGPNVPIGQDKVDEFFLRNVDTANWDRCVSAIDEERKLYLIAFPTSLGIRATNDQPSMVLAYNYMINQWSLNEHATDLLQTVASPALTLEDVGAIYPVIEDVPGSYENPAWQGGGDFLASFNTDGLSNGQIFNFSGPNKGFLIDTPEVADANGRRRILKAARPVTNCDCPQLAVGVRYSQTGGAPAFTAARSPNSRTSLCTFKEGAKGLYHRLRMTAPDGWGGDEVAGIDGIEFVDGGGP